MSFFYKNISFLCRILFLVVDIIYIKKNEVKIMKALFEFVWFLIKVCLMIFAGVVFGGIAHFIIESELIFVILGLILLYFFGPYILEIVLMYSFAKEIKKELDK